MTQVIVPCFVAGHYVVCRVLVREGKIECYDPILYRIDDSAHRIRHKQVAPLRYLIPWIFRPPVWFSYYEVEFVHGDGQFIQVDNVSCGVYCCMQLERLLSGSPSAEWAEKNIGYYRNKIACSIFELCQ